MIGKLGKLLLSLSVLSPTGAGAACVVDNRATVALNVTDDTITVPVEVNGLAARFVLDTGAQRSVVTDTAVRRLGLARDEWVGTTMRGLGGIARRPNADPRNLTLGGVPLVRRTLNRDTSLTVGVLPRTQVAGLAIDGLLGRDFLSLFDLDLDVPDRRLTLYQPHGCAGRFLPWAVHYRTIPATFLDANALVMPVLLDAVPLRAVLDTGSSTSLVAAPGLFRLGLQPASLDDDPADRVSGLGVHTVTMHRHRFRSLQVGGDTVTAPVLWVAPVHLAPIVDMLLGADWLTNRRIWISFTTHQLFVGGQ